MNTIECRVEQITNLTPYVYKVMLAPNEAVTFKPGQYLNLVMAEDDKRAFSIASAPHQSLIELQIGAFGEDSYAMQAIEKLKNSDSVTIEAPMGNAHLREESQRPLLLMAGGTGFSYIKSMFEHLAKQGTERPLLVYWGLRTQDACYELEQTKAMVESLPNARFIPVVEQADEAWQGQTGLVHQAVMKDIVSLEPYDIYLAGRFDMVGIVRNDFVEHGANIDHMYADAFAFI
ncbi:NAD(P)H-flavin reductase [Thalassotalea euphylliae]|uniref:NAD(P)H-flavin reductase n=1 Tax=Thalassotalea euphylliae TaxID=1655234 RepID=A0A3E0U351_9GAMM|nr:NAD(P)H-flavin reductase [Thalassotalea euphylliae]REL31356.1 NAD(P)H-flavin reductase [Thalassotalea euphylliae]